MELAYFYKLAKDNNGVKYILIRQALFDRPVDAKRMKTKDSTERIGAFLTMLSKKPDQKNCVDKGTEFA